MHRTCPLSGVNWTLLLSLSGCASGGIKKLTEQIHAYVDQLALASWWFIRDGSRTGDWQSAYPNYRSNIGRGILLGLELLVGADIIATITAPLTIMSVGLLGGIVLIRTFLSFSLETEIEGRWPWQRAAKDALRGERDQR